MIVTAKAQRLVSTMNVSLLRRSMLTSWLFVTSCALWFSPLPSTSGADGFPEIVDTQPGEERPPSPEEAAAAITFGDGDPNWQVTLFAGEPDVQQPIAFNFDDRGRLWVAENYSYAGGPYDEDHRDRVIILEDTDGRRPARRPQGVLGRWLDADRTDVGLWRSVGA